MAYARGLEVSMYQHTVDWPRVIAATGISFVMVKASDGVGRDPLFARHWTDARQAGLLRGAYHFLRVAPDPHQQVQAFLQALGTDAGELPPTLDIEDPDVHDLQHHDAAAHLALKRNLAAAAQVWLHAVEAQLGRPPLIYTAGWWWNDDMLISGGYPDWAPSHPLWVAHWPLASAVPDVTQIEQGVLTPILPRSWTGWTIWQYSGDFATVAGITTDIGRPARVDLDVFHGTLDDLRAFAQVAPPAAAPAPVAITPDPPPATVPVVDLRLPDPRVTNQVLINAFSDAFGADYWQVVQRAGLAGIADQRQAEYSGPAIEALANLTAMEQALLRQQLAQVVTGG